ncbi:MAG: endonuclease/exonuclease/phosphatase family protein [Rikenellaceae bacterium]|nr:endonuclease/exonuclease/phosphatase family protein [Rikenellaceae bacterium]
MKRFLNLLVVVALTFVTACNTTPAEIADSISVPDLDMFASADGSTVTISVTASNKLWTAESDADWCVVEQGEGSITLNIEKNTAEERTATITLTCGTAVTTIVVCQAPVEDTISVSTLEVTTPAAASTVIVGVSASSDDWSAKSNADWCGVEVGEGKITLSIAENTAEERTATVTLTCGTATSTIEVTQEDGTVIIEDEISVADILLNMPANAGSLTLNVTATGDWSVLNEASWLTAEPNDQGVLTLTFEANEGAERSATITLVCGEAQTVIEITQQEGQRIGVNPTSLSFTPEGGTLEIGVSANVSWKASTKDISWLTVTTKKDIVTVKAKANTGESERKGKVSITYTDAATNAPTSIDVEVVQSAYSVTYQTESVVLNSDQTSATVKFTASNDWTASICFAGSTWLEQIASPWATLSATSGDAGEQTLTVNFNGSDYKERAVSVVVKCGTLSKALNITQKATPAPSAGRKVRIMTFNQNIKGNQAIADVITGHNIDFVALQEVDVNTGRSGGKDQMESLKELTGYNGAYFCKTISFDGGDYGIGILSKKAALSTRFVDLPGSENRKLLIAEYDDFVFAATHFTYMSESEMRKYHYESALIVTEELSKYPDKPVALGGDFNTETDTNRAKTFGEIMTLMDLVSDPKVNTWPNTNSTYLLDHLFFKRDAKFPYIWTDGGAPDQSAADHRPVWAELQLLW